MAAAAWIVQNRVDFEGSRRYDASMPHYTATLDLACPVAELFAFLARPKNLVQLAPPDFHLELLTGPDVLERGSRLTWKGRRFGVSQHIVQEIAAFDLE